MAPAHDCGPKPEEPVEAALWTFASLANWGSPHPPDDDLFYKFVVVAHENKSQWAASDVRAQLEQYGLPRALARLFSERFWGGMCALSKRERMNRSDDSPVY